MSLHRPCFVLAEGTTRSRAMADSPRKMKLSCPSCSTKLIATRKLFGLQVRCPKCHEPISVPTPASEGNSCYSTVPATSAAHRYPSPSSPDTRACASCGRSLREGVTFCIPCGHHNYNTESASAEFIGDASRRIGEAREMPHELPRKMLVRGILRRLKRLIRFPKW